MTGTTQTPVGQAFFAVGEEVEVHGWSEGWDGPARIIEGPRPQHGTVYYSLISLFASPHRFSDIGAFPIAHLRAASQPEGE